MVTYRFIQILSFASKWFLSFYFFFKYIQKGRKDVIKEKKKRERIVMTIWMVDGRFEF